MVAKKKEILVKILENKVLKREQYFEILKLEKEAEGKRELIKEYLDNSEMNKLKKQLKSLDVQKNVNFIITELPTKKKSPVKKESPKDEEPAKKKKIIKRCPKGEKRDKKTGECVKKEEK